MESLSTIFPYDRSLATDILIILVAISVTHTAVSLIRLVGRKTQQKIIRSPRETLLPKLSSTEKAALPYPPDALPGGRDVDSPVSSRVYET